MCHVEMTIWPLSFFMLAVAGLAAAAGAAVAAGAVVAAGLAATAAVVAAGAAVGAAAGLGTLVCAAVGGAGVGAAQAESSAAPDKPANALSSERRETDDSEAWCSVTATPPETVRCSRSPSPVLHAQPGRSYIMSNV